MATPRSRYEGWLPASLVKEYLWCPAFAWLSWNGPPLRPPDHVDSDYALHPLEAEALARRLGARGGLRAQVPLRSAALRVSGKADYLAEPGPGGVGVVVEVKARGPWGGGDHQLAQAALYAVIAEEEYGGPFRAVVATPTGYHEAGARHRRLALRALAALREALASPTPPPGRPGARCASCAYRRICPWAPAGPG